MISLKCRAKEILQTIDGDSQLIDEHLIIYHKKLVEVYLGFKSDVVRRDPGQQLLDYYGLKSSSHPDFLNKGTGERIIYLPLELESV